MGQWKKASLRTDIQQKLEYKQPVVHSSKGMMCAERPQVRGQRGFMHLENGQAQITLGQQPWEGAGWQSTLMILQSLGILRYSGRHSVTPFPLIYFPTFQAEYEPFKGKAVFCSDCIFGTSPFSACGWMGWTLTPDHLSRLHTCLFSPFPSLSQGKKEALAGQGSGRAKWPE